VLGVRVMSVECPVCGNDTDLLTARQVAVVLGVVSRTVTEWCREGRFPGAELVVGISELQKRGVWRIPAVSVLTFMNQREQGVDVSPRPSGSP
jgi:Helix-turn-helix domain